MTAHRAHHQHRHSGRFTRHAECDVAPSHGLSAPALRHATAADVRRLATVLADAFFDDPVFGWLMPEDGRRHARLRRYFAIELLHYTLPRGRVWTTSDLAGAALSLPPGAWRAPARVTMMEGSAFGIHLPRAARMGAAMEWRHTRELREPHYYVRDIGVHPDMQGRGLGSALMRPTLERCDREGLPAYIEASSERSAALYERLGFEHIRELHVGASPPLWLMLRPAAPVQAMS
jgi:ribosomal protein S18 acetylase RimI-like enzyme